MIISLENLRAGIEFWNKWDAVPASDLINDQYPDIYGARELGIGAEWWKPTVDRLWAWKAIRSPRPPNTKAQIEAIGLPFLHAIEIQYQRIRQQASGEPSIEDLSWESVAPLFALALEIKNASPVFASKMCHFLCPKVFLVIDNWATGVMDYEFCWRGMKDEWLRFSEKEEARRVLQEKIHSREPIHPLYPFETKVMELCLTANYWKNRAIDDEAGANADIVRAGAEGGEIALVGERTASGWRFCLRVNENRGEFLDKEDLPTGVIHVEKPTWVHSWQAAVALLDQHPWAALLPLDVHSEFREAVWYEVDLRLSGLDEDSGAYRIDRWRKACRTAADSN